MLHALVADNASDRVESEPGEREGVEDHPPELMPAATGEAPLLAERQLTGVGQAQVVQGDQAMASVGVKRDLAQPTTGGQQRPSRHDSRRRDQHVEQRGLHQVAGTLHAGDPSRTRSTAATSGPGS